MVARALVTFADYNGYKDVDFVMREKDIEFRRSLSQHPITVKGMVDVIKGEFSFNGALYIVHADWSVSPKK